MSAATSIGLDTTSAATAASGVTAAGGNAYADLSSDEFLKIMLTELSNQDPFEPNDSQAILDQLSSLRSIESDLNLQEQLESLVLQNAIGQAGALIGKQVEGLSRDNETVTGIVTAVRVVDGKAQLELDNGVTLPIDRVATVTDAAINSTATTAAASVAPPATPNISASAIESALNAAGLSASPTGSENAAELES
jgi:flagellar basal-body rod modification protein FlgD